MPRPRDRSPSRDAPAARILGRARAAVTASEPVALGSFRISALPRARVSCSRRCNGVPGVELVDEVQLFPGDPLTAQRGDRTERIDLAPVALLFPFDLRVRAIGDR